MCYRITMNKEKPQGTNYRYYKKQRRTVKSLAKRLSAIEAQKISEAEVARRAIDHFAECGLGMPKQPAGLPKKDLRKMLKVKL